MLAHRQASDEQQDGETCEETVPVADVTSTYGPVAYDDGLRQNIDTVDSLTLARDGQAFRFVNSMETNAWQWNDFLDLSPIIDRSPPGNES
jgi:hypothetical protein